MQQPTERVNQGRGLYYTEQPSLASPKELDDYLNEMRAAGYRLVSMSYQEHRGPAYTERRYTCVWQEHTDVLRKGLEAALQAIRDCNGQRLSPGLALAFIFQVCSEALGQAGNDKEV